MLSPDLLFSHFLGFPPANPSNFHTVQMLLRDLFPCFSVRLSNGYGGVSGPGRHVCSYSGVV